MQAGARAPCASATRGASRIRPAQPSRQRHSTGFAAAAGASDAPSAAGGSGKKRIVFLGTPEVGRRHGACWVACCAVGFSPHVHGLQSSGAVAVKLRGKGYGMLWPSGSGPEPSQTWFRHGRNTCWLVASWGRCTTRCCRGGQDSGLHELGCTVMRTRHSICCAARPHG